MIATPDPAWTKVAFQVKYSLGRMYLRMEYGRMETNHLKK